MTATTTTKPAQQAVEQIVLELVGDLLNQDPGELLAAGGEMPVDSLDMLDILVEFRKKTGLTIPKQKLHRHTMRSIRAFAEFAAKEGQI